MASAVGDISCERFSQERLLLHLKTCVLENGDVSMDHYIAGLEELCKFMKQFEEDNLEFVLPEILENLSLLQEYRSGTDGEDYTTVQRMVDYELRKNLVRKESKPSGTRALLRFHRTLGFLYSCLLKVQDKTISDEDFPGEMVKIYTETLALFYPELLLTSVQWTLPTFLLSRVSLMENAGFAEDPSAFWTWLEEGTDHLKKLNEAVHSLLELSQLLDLFVDSV